MIEFLAHPECTKCDLHSYSACPGIPTRPANWQGPPAHSKALLVIGQNPGATEDQKGSSWMGWAGGYLNGTLHDHLELQEICDVYLSNVARCRTIRNRDPNATARKACFQYLKDDITALIAEYGPSNVVLLWLGAPAVDTCTGESIRRSVITQGAPRKLAWWPEGPTLPCFFSYHPASMAPGRDPSLRDPYTAHLHLLKDYLTGHLDLPSLPSAPLVAPADLPLGVTLLSLDIETYGILRGNEQTVFHPARMVAVDGRSRENIIVCASLAWREIGTGHLVSATYRWADPQHRFNFLRMMRTLAERHGTILGMNLPFDIVVLRYCFPAFGVICNPDNFKLDDISILNHLDSDMRPERSLKATSILLRSMDYGALAVNAKAGLLAASDTDPNLILYNCSDTIATLRNRDTHLASILSKHGKDHPALQPYGAEFRNQLLWVAITQTEAGLMFDRAALQALHDKSVAECQSIIAHAYSLGLIVEGKGSKASIQKAVEAAVPESLLGDPRLEVTNVKREISTGKANIHLLLGELPADSPHRLPITIIEDYRTVSKLVDTYTAKLLFNKAAGCLDNGMTYPTWFITPGSARDTSTLEGGQRQGRFSAKEPALQTFPDPLWPCLTSRYGAAGRLVAWDESQIELRCAALLSNDPIFVSVYNDPKGDIHTTTTLRAYPGASPSDSDFKNFKRQVGKRVNFLKLYRGGPSKIISSVRKDTGGKDPKTGQYRRPVELSESLARDISTGFDATYRVFRAWQDAEAELACRQGFLLFPLTGWKRTFLGGDAALDSYINEIANFPIQLFAAQVVQSAQFQIAEALRKQRLMARMCAQVYDSVIMDCHESCLAEVDAICSYWLTHAPLWTMMEERLGRTLPLMVDRKQLYPKV